MTIRFSAAKGGRRSLDRFFGTQISSFAANDGAATAESDALLRAALKHFARHGLGAADAAREKAEDAFFRGDRETYDHWLGICRLLDARMAGAVAAREDRDAVPDALLELVPDAEAGIDRVPMPTLAETL